MRKQCDARALQQGMLLGRASQQGMLRADVARRVTRRRRGRGSQNTPQDLSPNSTPAMMTSSRPQLAA